MRCSHEEKQFRRLKASQNNIVDLHYSMLHYRRFKLRVREQSAAEHRASDPVDLADLRKLGEDAFYHNLRGLDDENHQRLETGQYAETQSDRLILPLWSSCYPPPLLAGNYECIATQCRCRGQRRAAAAGSEIGLLSSDISIWGAKGITSSLVFFVCASVVVLIGTLLFGRRFQCSSICLFNGFAAEVFDPAIPLIGKRKKVKPKTLRFLNAVRWIFLSIALFFTLYWIFHLLGIILPGNTDVIAKIESYKYLAGELLMMMFFWIAFVGRGYCYFCPLGTVLSLFARIAGQRITTDNTKCVNCKKCDNICPMSIDISASAINGIAVQNIRCVGCGHCVDECPTNNLRYSTRFIDQAAKKRPEPDNKNANN